MKDFEQRIEDMKKEILSEISKCENSHGNVFCDKCSELYHDLHELAR